MFDHEEFLKRNHLWEIQIECFFKIFQNRIF